MSPSSAKKLSIVAGALVVGGLIGVVGSGMLGHAMMVDQQYGTVAAKYLSIEVDGLATVNTGIESVSSWTTWTEMTQREDSPGLVAVQHYTPVVLERHIDGADDLSAWTVAVVKNGDQTRRNIKLTLRDSAFRVLRVVELEGAIPTARTLGDNGIEMFDFEVAKATEVPPS